MLTVAVALTGLAALVVPQEPVAQSVAGRVLDQLGKPVLGATVTALHRPIPHSLEAGPEQRVLATTGAGGMFRALLPPDRTFSCWASWADGATAFEEGVMAGDFLILRQAAGSGPVRLPVTGLDAWVERGPLTFRALVGSDHIDFVDVPCVANVLEIPPLPPTLFRIVEILDREGEVSWAIRLDLYGPGPIPIPPPVPMDVLVTDQATGAPVAGAELRLHLFNYWYTANPARAFGDRFRCLWPVVGRTDAEGRARVRVPRADGSSPMDGSPRDVYLMARAAGFRFCLSGLREGKPFTDGKVDPDESAAEPPDVALLRLPLSGAETVGGPLLLARDLPAADGPLVLQWRVHIRKDGGGWGQPFHEVIQVRDGRYTLPSPPPTGDDLMEATALTPDSRRTAVRAEHGVSLPRHHTVERPKRLVAPDDRDLPPVEGVRLLQVVSGDGRPAERCVVLWSTPKVGRTNARGRLLRTDRLGRVLVPAPPGGARVVVLSPGGVGAMELPAEDGAPVTLALQALQPSACEVVDGEGKPVAGAFVAIEKLELHDDQDQQQADVNGLLANLPPVVTDAEGRCRVLHPGGVTLQLAVRGDNDPWGRKLGEAVLTVERGKPTEPCRIEVIRPDQR